MSDQQIDNPYEGKILAEGLSIPRGPLYSWSQEHFGPDFREKYKELGQTYLQILRERGAAELEAIYSCLIRIKSEEESEREVHMSSVEKAKARLDRSSGDVSKEDTRISELVLANATEGKQEIDRALSAISLRLTIIQRILHPYVAWGEVRQLGDLMDELEVGDFFESEGVYDLLQDELEKCDLISTQDFYDQWHWNGTQEQLSYLLFSLKQVGLLRPHDYWKRGAELFKNHDGTSFSSKQLRSIAGNLEYSRGGYPSTRGDDIDTIIETVLGQLDESKRQG